MVTGITMGLDSSEDEGIVMKRKFSRQKFLESDEEAGEDSNVILEAHKHIDSNVEPSPPQSADDPKSDSGVLTVMVVHGDMETHNKKKKKQWKILDSDCSSDEASQSHFALAKDAEGSEDEVTPENNVGHIPQSRFLLAKESDLYDAEGSEDEATPKHVEHSIQSRFLLAKESDLYDAEGSEDEATPKHRSEGKSKLQGRSVSERKSKSKAVQQIHSETQRLVRESRVSLPYHKPRQRSLAEFLKRRQTSTPSTTSLRMSTEDLGRIWKQLEQREKEAEQFYKSDSDESADGNSNCVIASAETSLCSSSTNITSNNTSNIIPSTAMNVCNSNSSSDTNGCVGETSTPDISINVYNSEIGISDSNIAVDLPNSKATISTSDLCSPETGVSDTVPDSETRSFVSTHTADSNYKTEMGPCRMVEDSCDFQLHYSESQSEDLKEPELITHSVLHNEESNALDAANTEDLILHYTETQDLEPASSGAKEQPCSDIQKQEKTVWWENLRPPSPDTDDEGDKVKTVLQSLARRSLPGLGDITKLKPRLGGTPNGVIELDGEESGPTGVVKLVERFMKHSAAKRPIEKKHTVEIGVVSAEQGADGIQEVHKDVVKVVLGGGEPEDDPAMAKPGAKLQRLKEELQQQIAQRRSEEIGRRLQEQRLDNEEEEELSDCGGLLDESEAEMTDGASETEEDEDDYLLVEKKRVKSAFLDDEADVSDDEGSADDEDETEEDVAESGKLQGLHTRVKSTFKENEVILSDGEVSDDSRDKMEEEEEEVASDKEEGADMSMKSVFEEAEADVSCDSSEEGETSTAGVELALTASLRKTNLERAKTFDLFASQEDIATQRDGGDSDLEMIPPYQPPGMVRRQATPSVDTKEDHKRRILDLISPISNFTSLRGTPSTQSQSVSPLTGRTVSGTLASMPKKLFAEPELSSTQDNMEELLGLCSGQFTGDIGRLVDPAMETSRTGLEDELMGLCSGKFTSQPGSLRSHERDEGQSRLDTQPISQSEFRLMLPSAVDEEDEVEVVKTKTHKRRKKLEFSDEESDLMSDATCELPDASEAKFVDYDSEENEVVELPKPRRCAASEFFEVEAELSESEWDSADEDEQGLDTLDFEEGDAEKLDQRKVKEQLDKIHMRRLLDEDRREVRLLQEILLDDGELHSEGGGRERKFRWKNINNVDDSDLPRQDSDNEGVEEVENEDELWRRKRHEREMFLQQQKLKADPKVDDVLGDESDSQLLKLGRAALRRINSQDPAERPVSLRRTVSDPLVSPDPKRPFQLLTKRGSFLARGENALARIAELTRGSTSGPVVGPKNSRNFVFATLSPEKVEEKCSSETAPVQVKKRKQCLGVTPPVVKRPRVLDEHSRGRKLLDLLT